MVLSEATIRWKLKPPLFLACLVPLGLMIGYAASDALGANPIEAIIHRTGDWALRMLLLTLAVTPLHKVTGWTWLIRFRRMLGLYAFFYAVLHFTAYIWLDQFFAWGEILADVIKRPYITVGFAAFLLLIPLAATSTKQAMRLLKRRWKTLHRTVYVIGILGVVHFWWLVKADIREPAIYATILSVLLGFRLVRAIRQRASAAGFILITPQSSRRNS